MTLSLRRAFLGGVLALWISPPLSAQTTVPPPFGQQAWQALEAGDPERADSLFHQALVASANDARLNFGAGIAAHLLSRDDDAERYLKRALLLNPNLADAAKWLGDVEYAMGNLDEAIRAYDQALALKPGDAALGQRLEAWQKEAAVHRGLTQRNDGRFSIIFEGTADSALADRALATLDAAFWRIGGALGAYPSSSITVTLYSERQFRDLTGAPEWADGVFDGKIRLPVQGARQNLAEFDRVLTHELTHAMISSLAPRGIPTWLHEGLASYFEPRDIASALRVLRVTGIVPAEVLFDSFTRLNDRQAAAAYAESLVFADLLMRRAGTHMGIVLQGLERGQSLEQSLDLIGIHLADLTAEITTPSR